MAYLVGSKGQVVISKEIRDQLGVRPGWMALQRVVDDHVELRFAPPEHNESLLGILAPYITRDFPIEEDLEDAITNARAEAAVERDARVVAEWQADHQVD